MFTDAVVAPGEFETRIAPIVVTVGVAPEHVTGFPLSRTWIVPPETVKPAKSFPSMVTISARPTRSHVTAPAAAGATSEPAAIATAKPMERASLRESNRGGIREPYARALRGATQPSPAGVAIAST
jgi:hypothetical protein